MLTADDVAGVVAWLAGLPARVHVPELTVLPAALQVLGRT
jgi:NADP-dependent 3-hydroxy acid dehydrogenase YdfG